MKSELQTDWKKENESDREIKTVVEDVYYCTLEFTVWYFSVTGICLDVCLYVWGSVLS